MNLIDIETGRGPTATLILPNGDPAEVATFTAKNHKRVRFVGAVSPVTTLKQSFPPAESFLMFSYLSRLVVTCVDQNGTPIGTADSAAGAFEPAGNSADVLVDPVFPTALTSTLVDPFTFNNVNGGLFPGPAPYPLNPLAEAGPFTFTIAVPPLCYGITVAAAGWNATVEVDACGDRADVQP